MRTQRGVIQVSSSLMPPRPVFKVYCIFSSRLLVVSRTTKVMAIAHVILEDYHIPPGNNLRGDFLCLILGVLHGFYVVHHYQCAVTNICMYIDIFEKHHFRT